MFKEKAIKKFLSYFENSMYENNRGYGTKKRFKIFLFKFPRWSVHYKNSEAHSFNNFSCFENAIIWKWLSNF